jgi:hypothetical protein
MVPRGASGKSFFILGASLLTFAVAAGAATAGARVLTLQLRNADLIDLANSIDQGVLPDKPYLADFAAKIDFEAHDRECSDQITRARLTVAVAADRAAHTPGETANETSSDRAVGAAMARLKCNPLDGNAWLQLGRVEAYERGEQEAALKDFEFSYATAPSEAWVLVQRLNDVTPMVEKGGDTLEVRFSSDLRQFVLYAASGQIAEAYVTLPETIRNRLRPFIDAQSQERRKSIVGEIDRLGVDYTRP